MASTGASAGATGADIYLDHAATSPLRTEVWEAMGEVRGEADHNPASGHGRGQAAARHLEEARERLAAAIDAPRRRVVLTGGGTGSDNLAVLGFARARAGEDPRVLVSAVEHEAVLGAARHAGREGARTARIPVDGDGVVDLDALDALLAGGDGPCLVSVMWANNEVGTVQPVAEAAAVAHRHGALFHTDAVQALGKWPVSVEEAGVDLLSATAHKLGGPVGIGLLYVAEGVELEPLFHGGSQERSLWPGTQNPLGAVGFAEAASRMVDELPGSAERWRALRDDLAGELAAGLPGLRVHGQGAPDRLPNLLSVGVPGVDTSTLLVSLELEGLSVSSGSACSSGSTAPSHVLEAMGVEESPEEYGVLRFSMGPETGREEVEAAGEIVTRVAGRLREGAPAGA